MLNNLSAIMDKAEAHAANRKIDAEVLLSYRLAPDMLPFVRQLQIAADTSCEPRCGLRYTTLKLVPGIVTTMS